MRCLACPIIAMTLILAGCSASNGNAGASRDRRLRAFTSKYDALLDGKAVFSAQELRGLALFNDPQRGNCAGCHPSGRGPGGAPPLFTDFLNTLTDGFQN